MSQRPDNPPDATGTPRRIGPVGTTARALGGLAFLATALAVGPLDAWDLVGGLLLLPGATTLLLRMRGADAPPLRWTRLPGHVANVVVGVAVAVVALQPALLFYGSAMLLAAARGYAGCELFAFANRINGREDEIGCPVFSPLDAVEANATRRRA